MKITSKTSVEDTEDILKWKVNYMKNMLKNRMKKVREFGYGKDDEIEISVMKCKLKGYLRSLELFKQNEFRS